MAYAAYAQPRRPYYIQGLYKSQRPHGGEPEGGQYQVVAVQESEVGLSEAQTFIYPANRCSSTTQRIQTHAQARTVRGQIVAACI
eukprot:3364037-Rhodomonas_salina.1